MNRFVFTRRTAWSRLGAARLPRRFPPALACTALAVALAAGCASQAGDSAPSGPLGTLRVTVIQAGGPPLPGGKTPESPVASTGVKVTGLGATSAAETGGDHSAGSPCPRR